jgi:hypothetical protein
VEDPEFQLHTGPALLGHLCPLACLVTFAVNKATIEATLTIEGHPLSHSLICTVNQDEITNAAFLLLFSSSYSTVV